jgi:hypothetical protein
MMGEMREKPGKKNSKIGTCPCGAVWNCGLTFSLAILAMRVGYIGE